MTLARKRKLTQLAARPDKEIDFSDIPPLGDSFWKNAIRNPFYKPVKQQVIVRLDSDVVVAAQQREKLSDPNESASPRGHAFGFEKRRMIHYRSHIIFQLIAPTHSTTYPHQNLPPLAPHAKLKSKDKGAGPAPPKELETTPVDNTGFCVLAN